ncbi:hypothetical protein H2199_001863 [Coniosporium tulheliwenetii]|uniref:Uncharacterized protein n=1 Tax=Coniosporium tulheliwenetii TaxID=3383036 RepID=A0ACC2ZKG7_9PEZI|nr:hypothetical protein H2199_001863 [Cladosporium sp. JES 115]
MICIVDAYKHCPYAFWHPFWQSLERLLPHLLLALQHLPNVEPRQVIPAAAPQLPFVLTFVTVAGGVDVAEGATELALVVAGAVMAEELISGEEEATLPEPPTEQDPKADWQPVPQWSAVEPLSNQLAITVHWECWVRETHHHPYCEQQFPNVEPEHVWPVVPPHEASVETLLVPAGGADEVEEGRTEVGTAELAPLELQVPKPDWHPVPQWSVVEPLSDMLALNSTVL